MAGFAEKSFIVGGCCGVEIRGGLTLLLFERKRLW